MWRIDNYDRLISDVLSKEPGWDDNLVASLRARVFQAALFCQCLRAAADARARGSRLGLYEWGDSDLFGLRINGREVSFDRRPYAGGVVIHRTGFPKSILPTDLRREEITAPNTQDADDLAGQHVAQAVQLLLKGLK